MTSSPLSDILTDCANSEIQQLGEVFGMGAVFPRKIK